MIGVLVAGSVLCLLFAVGAWVADRTEPVEPEDSVYPISNVSRRDV